MMNFFRYLFSRMFIVNLVLALLLVAGLLYGVVKYLDSYTLHGESISTPDFVGLTFDELDEFAENYEVAYVVVDTVYRNDKPRGTVVDQVPHANFPVKQNRKVYLTVNATHGERRELPMVKDVHVDIAVKKLTSYGFKVGELIYKPYPDGQDVVLGMEHKGEPVADAQRMPTGVTIDLIVGEGKAGKAMGVPLLLGMKYSEAQAYLLQNSLNTGALVSDTSSIKTAEDTLNAIVWRQSPAPDSKSGIRMGGSINMFISLDQERIRANVPDSLFNPVVVPADSNEVDSNNTP